MNLNKVYLCEIYQLVDIVYNDKNSSNNNKFLRVIRDTMFIKKTLVYYSELKREYIDLITKEKYKYGYGACVIGDYYINSKKGLTPLSSLINCKRKNMTKKRILKKYNKELEVEKNEKSI